MKEKLLESLRSMDERLHQLRSNIKKLKVKQVGRLDIRKETEALADLWVEEIRSPLEYRFKIPIDIINKYSNEFKQLHVLSRPNNLVQSYIDCLNKLIRNFKNDLILTIQQSPEPKVENAKLTEIISKITDGSVSDYLMEAVACSQGGHMRAGIVMGWCAAIDHIQKKIVMIGLGKFNTTSTILKNQGSGRFKRFNKEFKVTTINELQEVLDNDLIWILEGMELIDGNQGERLRTCFQYRNQSAHPGEAPINDHHLIAFFSDVVEIILTNPKFSLTNP